MPATSSSRALPLGGGWGSNSRWSRIFWITGRARMAAMIFSSPAPQFEQCCMSMSNIRLSSRAQLIRGARPWTVSASHSLAAAASVLGAEGGVRRAAIGQPVLPAGCRAARFGCRPDAARRVRPRSSPAATASRHRPPWAGTAWPRVRRQRRAPPAAQAPAGRPRRRRQRPAAATRLGSGHPRHRPGAPLRAADSFALMSTRRGPPCA